MPMVTPVRTDGLIDGRQSHRAITVRRGLQTYMRQHDAVTLPEVSLDNGLRADLVCLLAKGAITIVEIKTSLEDLRSDHKWPGYLTHCDRLYFATHPEGPIDAFPAEYGLIVTDGHAAECVREAPYERMASATRRSLTLQCARLASRRLERAERAANPVVLEPGPSEASGTVPVTGTWPGFASSVGHPDECGR